VVNGDHGVKFTHKELPVDCRKKASRMLEAANGAVDALSSGTLEGFSNGNNLKTG
jgi:hypothetical protein